MTITEFEYNLFLLLTLLLLAVKLTLSIYLSEKIINKKRSQGKISMDFVFGMFIFMVCLFISRIFYMVFDFVLTGLDPDKFYLMPNILFWKFGVFIGTFGFAFLIFILEKKALQFKTKGILSYFSIAMGLIILLWPVNTSDDFSFVSGLGFITSAPALIILIIFVYIGIKVPGLRKMTLAVVFGFIIYASGMVIVSEYILVPAREIFGPDIHVPFYFLFVLIKTIGLIIISYSTTKISPNIS